MSEMFDMPYDRANTYSETSFLFGWTMGWTFLLMLCSESACRFALDSYVVLGASFSNFLFVQHAEMRRHGTRVMRSPRPSTSAGRAVCSPSS